MSNLFVYGTLTFPTIFKAVTGKSFKTDSATLEGHKRYSVLTKEGYKPYPGITKEMGSSVQGVLVYELDDQALSTIDFFEGDEYQRVAVIVSIEGELVPAYTYVWRGGSGKSLDGEWSPEDFRKNYLDYYIEKKIPGILRGEDRSSF
jgi:gamma-glutamylcyclotransferase (GGCT)/AIG2-like uncharacterized protein YtfP